ncbi:MAG: hypothetical protein IPJ36_11805 [Simplicispira sp.]|nr:hypothetical protein [Simplicispira sp.]
MNNRFHSGRLAAVIFAAAALAACGGGGDVAESSSPGAAVLEVEARVQPPSLQEAAVIKSRALPSGERAEAVEISLGPLNLSKNALLQDPGARLIGLARPFLPADRPRPRQRCFTGTLPLPEAWWRR